MIKLKEQDRNVDRDALKKMRYRDNRGGNPSHNDAQPVNLPPVKDDKKKQKIDFKAKAIKSKEKAMKKFIDKSMKGGSRGPNAGKENKSNSN